MTAFPAYEDIYEVDGDELGVWMGVLFEGHIDNETAVALAWSIMEDDLRDHSIQPPRRCYVREAPTDEGHNIFVYQDTPGPDYRACTVIDVQGRWRYWCDAPRCENQFVPGSAVSGVPASTISNRDELGAQDPTYVYLCKRHHRAYEADLAEARKAAWQQYQAEHAAS